MEKITSSITPIEQVNKINEIIDNMGSRYIGEIIQSTIPLSDAGLHLLDGAVIQGGGIYSDFVNYIANLYALDPQAAFFAQPTEGRTAEQNWQSSVSTFGVCGKFVYDSVNNTVRLPKITGKLDGTTDTSVLGDLSPLFIKLPNITGDFVSWSASGAFSQTEVGTTDGLGAGSYWAGTGKGTVNFSASRSSSVYSGNGSDTNIHEQAVKTLFYIVIATSTKTDIEVDIDEIATDLNNKADKSSFQVVNSLPANPDANTFYFIPE